MKKLQWILNIIHFYIYLWFCYLHLGLNYINPIVWLLRLPYIENFFEKRGLKNVPRKITIDMFQNKTAGFSIMWAGGYLLGFTGAILYSSLLTVESLIKVNIISGVHSLLPIAIIFAISYAINYFLVFRNDLYLEYFRKIEMLPKKKRLVYGWLSFMAVLGVIGFFLTSLLIQ